MSFAKVHFIKNRSKDPAVGQLIFRSFKNGFSGYKKANNHYP